MVVDPAQLRRIEATHSGFLYQHLVGTAHLLLASTDETSSLYVERDEDIEIETSTRFWYAQVKHLADPLQPSDIDDILARFAVLRSEHSTGTRAKAASFAIVSSSEPSAKLRAMANSATWPTDVSIVSPSSGDVNGVPAWPDLAAAFAWCVAKAREVPFSKLDPETLVWKLAAVLQATATGRFPRATHRIDSTDLPGLREQLDLFSESIPVPPQPYRAQVEEPAIRTDQRVRVLSGVSGAGKTAWFSTVARHDSGAVAFARAAGGTADVSAWIVRHLSAAMLRSDGSLAATVFRPGLMAHESLALLDRVVAQRPCLVAIDNAHELDPVALARVIRDTTNLRWLLLAQPGPNATAVCERLAVAQEELKGWDVRTIASACAELQSNVSPELAARLRDLTAGVPLFVESTARLAKAHYGGDVEALLDARDRGEHKVRLPQESIVADDVLRALSADAKTAAIILSFARTEVDGDSVAAVVQATLEGDARRANAAIRELVDWSLLRPGRPNAYWLHDLFRPALESQRSTVGNEVTERGLRALLSELEKSRDKGEGGVESFMDMLRVMTALGEGKAVVDVVYGSIEWFREHSLERDVEHLLQESIGHAGLSQDDRFLAADALCFIALQRRDRDEAEKRLAAAVAIAGDEKKRPADWVARLALKRILLAGITGDKRAARDAYEDYANSASKGTEAFRVATYDYALALHIGGDDKKALRLVSKLVDEYFKVFALSPEQIFAVNPPELAQMVDVDRFHDELRHFADCLYLRSAIVTDNRLRPNFDALWAMKFYSLTGAYASAMRAGLEVADGLARTGGADAAIDFMESTMLPNVEKERLIQWIVPVYIDYAKLLADVGRIEDARFRMRAVGAFLPAMPDSDRALATKVEEWIEEQAKQLEAEMQDGLVTPPASIRRVSRGEFDQYKVARHPLARRTGEEIAWFERTDRSAIGLIIRDRGDQDFGWIVMKSDGARFVADDLETSLATNKDAAARLMAALERA